MVPFSSFNQPAQSWCTGSQDNLCLSNQSSSDPCQGEIGFSGNVLKKTLCVAAITRPSQSFSLQEPPERKVDWPLSLLPENNSFISVFATNERRFPWPYICGIPISTRQLLLSLVHLKWCVFSRSKGTGEFPIHPFKYPCPGINGWGAAVGLLISNGKGNSACCKSSWQFTIDCFVLPPKTNFTPPPLCLSPFVHTLRLRKNTLLLNIALMCDLKKNCEIHQSKLLCLYCRPSWCVVYLPGWYINSKDLNLLRNWSTDSHCLT